MTLTRDHNNIVFECDGKSCHQTLETGTSNFDGAQNQLSRLHWKRVKPGISEGWKHFCPDCQGSLI